MGHHRMLYAVEGHKGDWRQGNTSWEAARLNQPLLAFTAPAHAGGLGKTFSLLGTNSAQVQVVSVKKAEDSNEIVVRFRELSGQPASGVRLTSALPITGAREINGQEMPVGPASLENGALAFDLPPYQLRAFALQIGNVAASAGGRFRASRCRCRSTSMPSVRSRIRRTAGSTMKAAPIPPNSSRRRSSAKGISFQLGSAADGQKNAVRCRGQSLDLPAGAYNRVYLLAAACGDQRGEVKIDGAATPLAVQDWGGFIGQWDNRLWKGEVPELTYDWHNPLAGLVPGYIKRAPVAWYCSHRHDPKEGNEIYQYAYLFKYGVDLPAGARKLTLPDNDKVRVFAVSVASEPGAGVVPAAPLYDTFNNRAEGGPVSASPAPGRFDGLGRGRVEAAALLSAGQSPLHHGRLGPDGEFPGLRRPPGAFTRHRSEGLRVRSAGTARPGLERALSGGRCHPARARFRFLGSLSCRRWRPASPSRSSGLRRRTRAITFSRPGRGCRSDPCSCPRTARRPRWISARPCPRPRR